MHSFGIGNSCTPTMKGLGNEYLSKQLSVDSIMLILSVRMLGMMISVRMPGTGVKDTGDDDP